MAGRCSPVAALGSLLKGEPAKRKSGFKPGNKLGRPVTPPGKKEGIARTERDREYLALVRRLPCLSCDTDPAGVAAHVRMTRAGKTIAGTGNKPGDHWTLPLCATCHTDGPGAQHKIGEVAFWRGLGVDALVVCQRLYAASPDIEAMRAVVFAEREKRS